MFKDSVETVKTVFVFLGRGSELVLGNSSKIIAVILRRRITSDGLWACEGDVICILGSGIGTGSLVIELRKASTCALVKPSWAALEMSCWV